jgi:hypothetical protein
VQDLNLVAAWVGILLGILAGAFQGLFFHDEAWLGGYGSWRRRMLRLAHISFFGLAGINLAYAVSIHMLARPVASAWPSRLLVLGAILMPTVCYLSAAYKPLRHLFPIPVCAVLAGTAWFIWEGFVR